MTTGGKDAESGKRTRNAVVPAHLQPIATALGTLAIGWGGLEQTIAAIMVTMLQIPPQQGAIVAGNIELIQQIRIIRHLGVVVKLNKASYESLKSDLSLVENQICPDRNRMFHDLWIEKGAPRIMHRITLKPSLDKTDPNDWKLRQDEKPISALEISDLSLKVGDAMLRLQTALKDVECLFQQSASPDR